MSASSDLKWCHARTLDFLLFTKHRAACCFCCPRSPCYEHDYGLLSDTLSG